MERPPRHTAKVDDVIGVFLTRLPAELRDHVDAGVAAELNALVARARVEAPDVDLDPLAFAAYVAERVTFDADGRPRLGALHAGDLWIACGCVAQHPAALAAFERRYAPAIRDALARSFEPGLADDAELRLRERLLLVAGDDTPRLASYAGRGALVPWLR